MKRKISILKYQNRIKQETSKEKIFKLTKTK